MGFGQHWAIFVYNPANLLRQQNHRPLHGAIPSRDVGEPTHQIDVPLPIICYAVLGSLGDRQNSKMDPKISAPLVPAIRFQVFCKCT